MKLNKLFIKAFIFLFVFAFVSCKQIEYPEKTYIKCSATLDENPETFFAASERTIFPSYSTDFSLNKLTDIKLVIDNDSSKTYANYSEFINTQIETSEGFHTFVLTAKGECNLKSVVNKSILQGDNTIHFVLTFDSFASTNTGTGYADINFCFPSLGENPVYEIRIDSQTYTGNLTAITEGEHAGYQCINFAQSFSGNSINKNLFFTVRDAAEIKKIIYKTNMFVVKDLTSSQDIYFDDNSFIDIYTVTLTYSNSATNDSTDTDTQVLKYTYLEGYDLSEFNIPEEEWNVGLGYDIYEEVDGQLVPATSKDPLTTTGNKNLILRWKPKQTYNITFMTSDGDIIENDTVIEDTEINTSGYTNSQGVHKTLPVPEKENMSFLYWYRKIDISFASVKEQLTSMIVNSDVVLYAEFTNKKVVKLETNGGVLSDQTLPQTVFEIGDDTATVNPKSFLIEFENSYRTYYLPKLYKKDLAFAGWYTDKECTKQESLSIDGNVTLYAKFNEPLFNEIVEVTKDKKLIYSHSYEPGTSYYYRFADIYNSPSVYESENKGKVDINIEWIKESGETIYTSYGNENGYGYLLCHILNKDESDIKSFNIYVSSSYNIYGDVYVELYDGDVLDYNNLLVDTYKVSFDTGIGLFYDPIDIIMTEAGVRYFDLPSEKNEKHYVLDSWYKDSALTEKVSTCYDLDDITSDITLYAKWIPPCEVIINSNGGTEVDSLKFTIGSTVTSNNSYLEEYKTKIKKEGYIFGGYYTDIECTKRFSSCVIEGNIELFVKWLKGYTLSFDTGCDATIDDIQIEEGRDVYKYCAQYSVLPDKYFLHPQRDGYLFNGWYFKEDDELIYKKVNSNITLEAKWSPATAIIDEYIKLDDSNYGEYEFKFDAEPGYLYEITFANIDEYRFLPPENSKFMLVNCKCTIAGVEQKLLPNSYKEITVDEKQTITVNLERGNISVEGYTYLKIYRKTKPTFKPQITFSINNTIEIKSRIEGNIVTLYVDYYDPIQYIKNYIWKVGSEDSTNISYDSNKEIDIENLPEGYCLPVFVECVDSKANKYKAIIYITK